MRARRSPRWLSLGIGFHLADPTTRIIVRRWKTHVIVRRMGGKHNRWML
jgi:hypothetical protein